MLSEEDLIEKRIAREILSMIEEVYFSKKYQEYRIDYGSNGTRYLIISKIKERYKVY